MLYVLKFRKFVTLSAIEIFVYAKRVFAGIVKILD